MLTGKKRNEWKKWTVRVAGFLLRFDFWYDKLRYHLWSHHVCVCRSVGLYVYLLFAISQSPITVSSVRHDPICLRAKSNERNKLTRAVCFVRLNKSSIFIQCMQMRLFTFAHELLHFQVLAVLLRYQRQQLWLAQFSAHGIYLSMSSEILGI